LARTPRANTTYWGPKLARNIERDTRAQADLSKLGWSVLVVWECETLSKDRLQQIAQRLAMSRY
jgi:DNA mismatch endonuclease, patch repair protein